MGSDRRTFVRQAAAGLAAWPSIIRRALAQPAARKSGTVMDVQHVVILMQENRSFDHYFGTLRGVRGFSDPRPVVLPSGKPVWQQPGPDGSTHPPFHLDTKLTSAQWLASLDHSWKGSHALWKHHDNWISAKGPLTMGHFERADVPFYHALADAFTICDAYHCSVFGPTNPNRLFLFSGTNGLAVGNDGLQAIVNSTDEVNETADQANDSKTFQPYRWTTYAERLSAAGISWRVYQEYDNFGDNALAYFARFRGLDPASEDHRRARGWPAASTGVKNSHGGFLIEDFAADVAAGRLPQVSWIVAPTDASEHPEACPGFGQAMTARLIAALTANPDVWAKTVFFLNFDENDGFFDHVPPPVPPISPDMGKSTVSVAGESYKGEPVGLGPRVPMLVVSPWSKGGFVCSQLFDHTSVIRFLEKRFSVTEPNITPWRRAVCGDLVNAFDFSEPDETQDHGLPDTGGYAAEADAQHQLPPPRLLHERLPRQEKGLRPARSLPYALEVTGEVQDGAFVLDIVNRGAVGATLTAYAPKGAGPWFYTVEAGQTVSDGLPLGGHYRFDVHGPNGFLRQFQDGLPYASIVAESRYDGATDELVLAIRNTGNRSRRIVTQPLRYLTDALRHHRLAPGEVIEDRWPIADSGHWYDIELRCGGLHRRWAGHIETGRTSQSDPGLGAA
ncbi:MAG TPA: phospholipase C, phosphocholine-specific [Rhizomicrobium sp.]|nr:phospholipase C, phosphocholine-specific [Rhizomicrobium sp.]